MNHDGYTLVELLVVLLLVSIISVAVAGSMHFGAQVWQAVDEHATDANDLVQAHRVLRAMITSAVPKMVGAYVSFDGNARTLSFDAIPPRAAPAPNLVHIEISVPDGKTEAFGIELRDADRRMRSTQIPAQDADLNISYLDAEQTVPVWLSRWRDRDRLPDAIRVMAANSGGRWHELIVRLPVSQLPGCQFDPVSNICRK